MGMAPRRRRAAAAAPAFGWLPLLAQVFLLVSCLPQAHARRNRDSRCPQDEQGRECGGRGLCRRGMCLCDPGFGGTHCAPKEKERERGGARPRYGRAYAQQLKQDLASEMSRRKAENDRRMAKLRMQFKDQNKNIESQSAGVRERLERERVKNAEHINEMRAQREVEVDEITANNDRIKAQVEGVASGLSEQLAAEYDEVTQAGKTSAAGAGEGDEIALEDGEGEGEEGLPPSKELHLSAEAELYDVVSLHPDELGPEAGPEFEEKHLYEDGGYDLLAPPKPKAKPRPPKAAAAGGGADGGGSATSTRRVAMEEKAARKWTPPPPPPPPLAKAAAEESYETVVAADDDDDFL